MVFCGQAASGKWFVKVLAKDGKLSSFWGLAEDNARAIAKEMGAKK